MDRPPSHDAIAALPMYDWPEARGATDAFWAHVRDRLGAAGIAAPATLSRDLDAAAVWSYPRLTLGQTCGLPFVRALCGDNLIVARPDYGVEGAEAGLYRSAIVARREAPGDLSAFRGSRAAINGPGSQSGMNALLDAVGDRFFGSVAVSGAHRLSARMVAAGEADLAALDANAWAMLRAYEPETARRLRVVEWTRQMPALPYITSCAEHRAELCDALAAAAGAVRAPGLPVAIRPADALDYDPIRTMDDELARWRLTPAG